MNILFTYSYCDAANQKTDGEIIFSNPENLTLDFIEYKLRSSLTSGVYFHHNHFMVQPLYGQYPDFDKNPAVHEFDDVKLTTEDATDKRNIGDFIGNIKWRRYL